MKGTLPLLRDHPLLLLLLLIYYYPIPLTTANGSWMYLGVSPPHPSHEPQPESPQSPTLPVADQPPEMMLMQLAGDAPAPPDGDEEGLRRTFGEGNLVNPPDDADNEHSLLRDTTLALCKSLPGLVSQQIQVCQNYPDTIPAIADGARRGIRECQFQFRNERWNCSHKEDDYSVFGYELTRGSKETAFIYAITSAGVVHAVTQACSSGGLNECSCDLSKQGRSTPEGWKWGGCSDNLKFGIQFSRKFVDAPDKDKEGWGEVPPKSVQSLMNLHNNEAGRQAVAHLMRMQCRCHGVSGSCELKTCWKNIPTFTQIGDYLKRKYQKSTQVPLKSQKRLRRKSGRKFPVGKGELVHLRKSPDYCQYDPEKGILGTSGRLCNKTSEGNDRCSVLCCGRGFNTKVVKKVERCQCKFIWCCYVKCKPCITKTEIHTCK